jgi:hypothetical protein
VIACWYSDGSWAPAGWEKETSTFRWLGSGPSMPEGSWRWRRFERNARHAKRLHSHGPPLRRRRQRERRQRQDYLPNARSGRPSASPGGGCSFIQRRRPGRNHLVKKATARMPSSGPVADGRGRVGGTITEYRPRRLHMGRTGITEGPNLTTVTGGGLVSRPLPDPYVSDPVEQRPPWCICDPAALLRLDADGPPGSAKCGCRRAAPPHGRRRRVSFGPTPRAWQRRVPLLTDC